MTTTDLEEARLRLEDRVQHRWLSPLLGPTATITALSDGFLYEDSGRRYRLLRDRLSRSSNSNHQLLLAGGVSGFEAWAAGRYHVTGGDISIAWCRLEAARALARGDAELERAIRTDLWRFAYAARFAGIAAEDLGGMEEDSELLEEERRDVLIQGLGLEALAAVAGVAADFGAEVLVAELAK